MEQIIPPDLPVGQVRCAAHRPPCPCPCLPGRSPAGRAARGWLPVCWKPCPWPGRLLLPSSYCPLACLPARSYKQFLQQAAQELRGMRGGPGGVQLFNLSPAW